MVNWIDFASTSYQSHVHSNLDRKPVIVSVKKQHTTRRKNRVTRNNANRGIMQGAIGARSRNRTGTAVKPRDFKSLVSTNFTIRADLSQTGRPGLIMEAGTGVEPAWMELQSTV